MCGLTHILLGQYGEAISELETVSNSLWNSEEQRPSCLYPAFNNAYIANVLLGACYEKDKSFKLAAEYYLRAIEYSNYLVRNQGNRNSYALIRLYQSTAEMCLINDQTDKYDEMLEKMLDEYICVQHLVPTRIESEDKAFEELLDKIDSMFGTGILQAYEELYQQRLFEYNFSPQQDSLKDKTESEVLHCWLLKAVSLKNKDQPITSSKFFKKSKKHSQDSSKPKKSPDNDFSRTNALSEESSSSSSSFTSK